MMRRFQLVAFFSLFYLSSLHGNFIWKGSEYHENSTSQQMVALGLIKDISFKGNEIVLDVGCGDGKITKVLSELIPEGYVIGTDLSPSQISFAKSLEHGHLSFEICDVQELPYDKKFDLITSFTALQWVPDQWKAFSKIHRALKPGGKLFFTVPTGITWELSEAVRLVIERDEWKSFPFRDKQYFFSREAYASILHKAGFVIESFKIVPTFNVFQNRSSFIKFVKQWLPFVQDVPLELQDSFMAQIMDVYETLLPALPSGEILFDKYVYYVKASRRGE